MNRPNPKDYATYGEYDVAMNKYCDELEAKLASYIDAESAFKHKIEMCEAEVFTITKRNIALQRMLNQACYNLSLLTPYCPVSQHQHILDECSKCKKKCIDEWIKSIEKEVQDE